MQDKNWEVRSSAAESLAKIGSEAVSALTGLLRDQNGSVQEAAADALGKIGPEAKAAIPALALLVRPQEQARNAAARALRSIGPAVVPVLIELLRDKNEEVQEAPSKV